MSPFLLALLLQSTTQPLALPLGEAAEVRSITWTSGDATLAGSLYVPKGAGPFPTVMLVHASGQSTRFDWPYRTHAEFLVEQGIAVLTFDKRGTGDSTGRFERIPDFDLLVGDVLAGVARLKAETAVDARRLGLWGRSQGAWVVALAAARTTDVRFVMPIAGGAVAPYVQELFVQAHWMRRSGVSEAQVAQAEATSGLVWRYYATGEGREAAQRSLDELQSQPWFPSVRGAISGYPKSGVLEPPDDVAARRATTFRWQAGLFWDPAEQWRRIRVPVLAILGGGDTVTPTEASAAAFAAVTRSTPGASITVHVFPRASHALCSTSRPEALVDGCPPVDGYEELLVRWIRDHTR